MRVTSLLFVFMLAKIMVLADRIVTVSGWALIAFVWQDLAVVLVFAALTGIIRRAWFGWTLYGVAVAYAALNVPIARLLSSPLTWPMVRATQSALSDSIAHHFTVANVAMMLLVACSGALIPLALRRFHIARRWQLAALATAAILIALGPWATSNVDTGGLHRNPFAALIATAVPRIGTQDSSELIHRGISLLDAGAPNHAKAEESLEWLSGAAQGRNVVLISLESTGAEYLKLYGAAEDPMPNLTQLAAESIVFENAYAVYPESIKGFFSVLCSVHPAIDTRTKAYREFACTALPQELAAVGYSTALFHSGRFMYLGMQDIIQNRGYQTLEDAGAISGNFNSSFGVDEPSTVQRILDWIGRRTRGEKFFITYLPIAGHHPYDSPEGGPFTESDERGRYLNAIHHGDSALGQLIDGIKQRGLFEQTIFVIYGDHGEAFGQHEGNFGHTLSIYEENVRVPLIIVAPGLVREQQRITHAVSLVDIAPTILDSLRLPVPSSFEGRSLLADAGKPVLFFTDYSMALLGLRDGRWKFIHAVESNRSKLFDLDQDPGELNNISSAHADRVNSYREYLRRWSAKQRARILNGSLRGESPKDSPYSYGVHASACPAL